MREFTHSRAVCIHDKDLRRVIRRHIVPSVCDALPIRGPSRFVYAWTGVVPEWSHMRPIGISDKRRT